VTKKKNNRISAPFLVPGFLAAAAFTLFASPWSPAAGKNDSGPKSPSPPGQDYSRAPGEEDRPIIDSFNVDFEEVLEGENVMVRWSARPHPGGSPLAKIRIEKGGRKRILDRPTASPEANGDLSVRISRKPALLASPTPVSFTLTVTNEAGRSVSRKESVKVHTFRNFSSFLRDVSVEEVPSFVTKGDPAEIRLSFTNESSLTATSVLARVYHNHTGHTGGPVKGELAGVVIRPGKNLFHIPVESFKAPPARPGKLVVTLYPSGNRDPFLRLVRDLDVQTQTKYTIRQ
jgi:hypothetical protein